MEKIATKTPLRRQAASHVIRQHTLEEGRTTPSSPATAPAQSESSIRTRSPSSCSTVLPLVPEGFGFSTTAPASRRRPYPEGPEDRAYLWETRTTETWIAFRAPRRILMDVRPRLTPLAASEQTNWTTPPSCAYTPPRTHTHRDLPRHVPSPKAYASPVRILAPNTGGLPPGNEPISRLHCQALRHSPPPDTSTKLCCGVPKEPQPDDDGRNLAPVG